MVLQQFLDPCGEAFALVKHCLERAGEAGSDQCGGARDEDGLLIQCRRDFPDQPLGHTRCLGTDQGREPTASGPAHLGGRAELVEEPEHGRVLDGPATGC